MSTSKALVLARSKALSSPVAYLRPDEVQRLAEAASKTRKGERNELLVLVLYQTGLRISEALSLKPSMLIKHDGVHCIRIKGKGGKERLVHLPKQLYDHLLSYAFRHKLGDHDHFFAINRQRAHKIISEAGKKAGLGKRVYPHLLRHSDAIERLRQTGNPKALQLHLGHSSMAMTMRYLSTLSMEDALKIQERVEF